MLLVKENQCKFNYMIELWISLSSIELPFHSKAFFILRNVSLLMALRLIYVTRQNRHTALQLHSNSTIKSKVLKLIPVMIRFAEEGYELKIFLVIKNKNKTSSI